MTTSLPRYHSFWLAVGTGLLVAGCGCGPGKPPAGVPSGATRISVVKGYIWQYCVYDDQQGLDRCSIYHYDGEPIRSEVFVPYDGGAPVPEAELQIAEHPVFSDVDRIYLRNGRILIPASRRDDLTRFLDWKTGKRPQP
jgi:hypothetical protein